MLIKQEGEMGFEERINELEQENIHLKKQISKLKKSQDGTIPSGVIDLTNVELGNIIDTYPEAVVFLDNNRKFIKINSSFTKVFGYYPREIEGLETRLLYLNEESYQKAGKDIYLPNVMNGLETYEVSLIRKNGESFPAEITGRPLYDNYGESFGYFGIIRDLSKEKTTSDVDNFFESTDHISLVINQNSLVIVDASSNFELLFGYSKDKIKQRSFYDLVHLKDKPSTKKYLEESIAAKEKTVSFENRCITKNGVLKVFSWNVSFSYKKRLCYITGIDISNKFNEINELRFKASLLDQIEDRITACDLDGIITYVNHAEARTFGKPRDYFIGRSVHEYGEDISRGASQQNIIDKTIENGSWQGKVINFNEQGKAIVFNSRTSLIYDEDEKPVGMVGVSTDITHQEEQAMLLKESENKFKSVFEQGAIGELIVDEKGWIIESNKTIEQWISSQEDLRGRKFYEIFSVEDQHRTIENFEKVKLNQIEKIEQIVRVVHSDGHYIWCRLSTKKVQNPELRSQTFVIAITDITEIHESQQALQDNEELFRTIFTQSAVGISRVSAQGEYIIGNKRFCEITGYTHEELKKLHFKKLTHASDFSNEAIELNKMLSGETNGYDLEKRIWHKSGRLVWVHLYVSLVRDYSGKPKYWIATLIDITEQKKNESKLRKLSERLQLAMDSGEIGIWDMDISSNIVYWNPQMHELYEVNEEDFKNQFDDWRGYIHPDDKMEFDNKIHQAIFEKKGFDAEYRIITPLNKVKIIKAFALLHKGEKDSPDRLVGVNIDVTENRKINENLKSALKDKEILLRELYHRTKNNMQVVCAMLDMEAMNQTNEKVEKVFSEMGQRIQTMSLVHNKLYQSQNLSNIDLEDYLKELANLLIQSNCKSDQRIKLITDIKDVNVIIEVAIPIGLIINELITNTLKYAFCERKTGKIEIKTHNEEEFLILTYSDDGKGLDSGFDIEKDSNLGLTLVRNLSERQLDGKYRYKTGKGFSFQVKFVKDIYKERV